ncbi:hypothetical protein AX14_007168 [Amanita brunnescens Koide BX004]|nr:hypothetical protein AX14_007168 [Amanita brunnescens Koide BX004]
MGISVASVSQQLWKYYLDYLWYYEPDSWVARTANVARLLAILVALPIVILGLLDIASYGIARTLGVIDDVKASTSDMTSIHGIHENGSNSINLSHPGTITAPDDTASPVRSEEELYSVTPDTAAPDVSTAESSASEEQSVDHTLHNLKVNNSSQSLLLIPSIPARTRSNAWETASISDGVLHQRQAQRAERDP